MELAEVTVERAVETWRCWQDAAPSPTLLSVVQIAGATFAQVPDEMLGRLDDLESRVVGAARLGYADEGTLRAGTTTPVDVVAPDDDRLARLEDVTAPDEWLEAGFDRAGKTHAVVGDDGELEAIATVEDWYGLVGHLGVLTRADCRGRRLAGATAGAASREALGRGLVAQWRARVGNDASQRVADRLGFVTLGVQLFVRFPRPDSSRIGP